MAKHLVVVTRSWPVTQGLPLALHELAVGTVSTDPLVALHFFFSFLDPKYWGKWTGAQGTNRGLTSSNKGHEAARVTLPLRDFRKNAELSMCKLTTGWILEKCLKSNVCTYHNMDFRKNAELSMCELTTEWILESAQSFTVCTYIFW